MQTISENEQKSATSITITTLYYDLWGIFSRFPDWAMSLSARLAIAGIFWRSGQTKVSNWQINEFTIMLFESEYALPLIPAKTAAYMATFAEHFFPALLVIGLATRFSAAALLFMTLVIQVFVYPASWPDHLVWAVSMLYNITRGPGILSLDYLIKRKLP